MTPQEKAKELVEKFKDLVAIDYQYDYNPIFECQKQCAIIAVDEILNQLFQHHKIDYWKEVKTEIEKL